MSAIDFVVRNSVGAIQHGSVGGDGITTQLIVGSGSQVSLNLDRDQIVSYEQAGGALKITLVDGQVIYVDNFFGPGGTSQADLFISANGQLAEVELVPGPNGTFYSNYIAEDMTGKWSPDDQLLFAGREEPIVTAAADDPAAGMLVPFAAPAVILPLLSLIGVGAGTTVLDSSETRDPPTPEGTILSGTKDTGYVVNAEDQADGTEITGTGTVGATVTVTVGDDTQTTVIGEDGTWSVTFPTDEVGPGTYEEPVIVIVSKDGQDLTITDTLVVDTEASVTFVEDSVGGDGTVNAAEVGGVILTGTTEVGSTVFVTTGGVTYEAAVDGTTWTVALPADAVIDGEYQQAVTVEATDAHGNIATTEGSFTVDTETSITMNTGAIGGDGTVNAVEHAGGVTVTGTAEAGASVLVTIGGANTTVIAANNGTWTASFASGQIPGGTYGQTVTAVATDAAGNTASTGGTIKVDTDLTLTVNAATVEANGIVNAAERSDGVAITGKSDPGSTVTVEMCGVTHTAVTAANGTWKVVYSAAEIPPGTHEAPIAVSSVDAAGNTAIVNASIMIDSEARVAINAPVEGDNVINASERSDGVVLTGTTEPGSTVIVTFGSATLAATVAPNGTWTVSFPATAVAPGTYETTAIANAVDANGNSSSATITLQVDTETSVTVNTANFEGDGTINYVEREDGVTLTGQAEAGASVVVRFGSASRTVTAGDDGNWSASFGKNDIPTGETTAAVTATATDAAGNSAMATGSVKVDTFVNRLDITSGEVGGDDIINKAEAAAPVTINGVVEQGSTVVVTLAGVSYNATVAGNGNWTVTFPAGSLPLGEYATEITVAATDKAGNAASISQDVLIDTVVGEVALSPDPIEIDDVINATERSDGVLIEGTATPGLTVTVTLGGKSHQVVAGPDGTWSSLFAAGEIPSGTYNAPITASITDSAGNSKTVSDSVAVDTEISFTLNKHVEGDNTLNAAEASNGVQLSGTVEAGSRVTVVYGGSTQTVTANADGTWSLTVPAAAVAAGEYNQSFTATATDKAGNSSVITHTVRIDTFVNELSMDRLIEGDDVVNRVEAQDGITINGEVEAGSTVFVTFEGTTRQATVAADGSWTVNFTGAEVPQGEYDAAIKVEATDSVGNAKSITETIAVDTTPPEAPLIESYTRAGAGVRAISTSITDDTVEIHSVAATGTVSHASFNTSVNTDFNEIDYSFTKPIPNGSHLVITSTDEADNNTSTLFVLEEPLTNTVDVRNAGLSGFNIEAIDLQFAEDSHLTLTAQDLEALCSHSNTLTVHGGVDDTVTILGASDSGETTDIDGRAYKIYDFGAHGGTVIIDEEIHVVT
ncbi:MAG: Ig-like domain-containing protein [Rhodobacterales bacterium]|nr:Ig-like domain-containing protein [Rhodobacterales bacterium]